MTRPLVFAPGCYCYRTWNLCPPCAALNGPRCPICGLDDDHDDHDPATLGPIQST